MPIIIDGKTVSLNILSGLKAKAVRLREERNVIPCIALLLVGDNPASKGYIYSKEKACRELAFKSIVVQLPAETEEKEVLDYVYRWNNDPLVHGILVQLPLPKQINEQKVIFGISPEKDVDGFHPESMGRLVIGLPGFIPCTPAGIMVLLKEYNIPTSGKHVVVVGRSNIVGKPIANLLYQKNPNANSIVTICHTGTKDYSVYTKQADILIAAMGVPQCIKSKDVKEGVVVIDVGMNRLNDPSLPKGYRLVGDVDYEDVSPKAYAITPVPGGVGPMTIAMLMKNTYKSAAGDLD